MNNLSGSLLTEGEKASIDAAMAQVQIDKQKRAERIKRCNEDPVFKAQWERELAEKINSNAGIQGSRYADPPSRFSAPVFQPARQTGLLFQPRPIPQPFVIRPEPPMVVFNMVDGNASPPLSIAATVTATATATATATSIATDNATIPTPNPTPAPANRGLAGSRWATTNDFVPPHLHVKTAAPAAPKNIAPVVSSGYVPPHLRKPGASLSSGTTKGMEPVVSSGFVPPHLRKPGASLPMDTTKSVEPVVSAFVPPHLPGPAATSSNGTTKSIAPVVSSGFVPPHLRVPVHQAADKMVSQGEKKDDAKQVILTLPVQVAVKSAPEPYILPHLRVPSSKTQPTSQTSTSSNLQPNLPSSSQGVISQPSTTLSSSTALPGPPALVSAAQIPTSVNQNVALQFRAANMRDGVNVRKCDAMNFFRHGPNPVEAEYELYTHTPSDSSSGSSSHAPINTQVQASALQTTMQAAPKVAAVVPQINTVLAMNQAQSSGTMSSGRKPVHEKSSDDFKQYIESREKTKAAQAIAPTISQTDLKTSSGNVGDSTVLASAPVLPESTPVVLQGTAATSSTADALFTTTELSFMQTYVKPVRHPHQWKLEELKELREYERLMKIKSSQPRAPGIASIAEFMASRAKQGPISTKYGAPKKVTPPASPNSKSKTPSPKIRRPPLSIDPSRNPAWNLAGSKPGDFMAHVNARVPDGKSKKYSGKAINQAETEDLMSTRRAGLQVWVDDFTTGDDAAAESSKKENIQPALKENSISQKPVIDTPLFASEKSSNTAANLPPHLRLVNIGLEKKLPQKSVVETSVAASSSNEYLPPHLRVKQKLPQKVVVETSVAVASSTFVTLPNASPPHVEQKLPQKVVVKAPVAASFTNGYLPPHLRVKPKVVVEVSAAVKPSTALPPHLQVGADVNRSDLKHKTSAPNSTSTNPKSPRGGVRSADGDGWSSPEVWVAQVNMALASSNLVNNSAPNSISTNPKDPRGGVRSADDDGWGSVPPDISMGQVDMPLAALHLFNNAVSSTRVLPQLRTSNPPLDAPKMRELNSPSFKAPSKEVSPPKILPLHLRPNVALRKPTLTKDQQTMAHPRPVTSPSPGFLPPHSGKTSFGSSDPNCFDPSKVSDDGVVEKPKENIRATQGRSATDQLLDFDGSWLPPPQWDDRGEADYRYMGQYINEWSSSVPPPTKLIDTAAPEFVSGTFVVGDDKIISPPVHGPTLPVIQPEIEDKRTRQTANAESEIFTTALMARNSNAQADAQANAEMLQKLREEAIEPDSFRPTTDLYLRPATTKDLAGIVKIYNYWVNNSIIPEDQKDVTEQDMAFLLHGCKANDLPFLVAVKGKTPCNTDSQGRKLKRVASPQNETIIGYTFAQIQAFGFGSANTFKGRSRMNANLYLYVDHEFQKKGVGRNLLDRLLLTLYHAHSFRNGAEFVNPENDKRYGRVPERWNRVHFQVAVAKKDDTDFPRTSRFLSKSFFQETSRLVNGARTATKLGACRFADLVTFSRVAVPDDVWGPHD